MKYFIAFQKTHWALYTLGYFIKVFIEWKFTNPFQWVLDIPRMTNNERAEGLMVVFVYAILIGIIAMIPHQLSKDKEFKNNQNK
jgi:hypothetical protein